jgi:large subunit ribosomal protein L18
VKQQKIANKQKWRRANRVRKTIRGDAARPRLSVHRSNKHIYCQVIDDEAGKTIASASTRDKDLASQVKYGGNREAAKLIGQTIAQRATAAGVKQIQFDRGSFRYHGRLAELADAAREGGLEF